MFKINDRNFKILQSYTKSIKILRSNLYYEIKKIMNQNFILSNQLSWVFHGDVSFNFSVPTLGYFLGFFFFPSYNLLFSFPLFH